MRHSRVMLPHNLDTRFLKLMPVLDPNVPQGIKAIGEERSRRDAFKFIGVMHAGRDIEMAGWRAAWEIVVCEGEDTVA